ncbi:putative serine/threonine-protein kinase nek3 [Diplonema papillatum]|nr:putative serine/threonine-protein kinase nek3 [Diplonema papillatum]
MDAYTEVSVLGKGSFGTAVLCDRKQDGTRVVVKSVSALRPKDAAAAVREIDILAALDHPNIIRYFDSFEANGQVFIAAEYADGGDLHQYIEKQREGGSFVGEEMATSISIQMLVALKYLHAKRILHRDLKPANIFLTKNHTVKLGDFGVATILMATQVLAKTFCGTLHYLSPEVCEEQPYNNKADVWALGCCIYEMITLRRAFDAKSVLQLGLNIVGVKYTRLGPNDCCADLRNLVEAMLQKAPGLRPNASTALALPCVMDHLSCVPPHLLDTDRYKRVFGSLIPSVQGLGRRKNHDKNRQDIADMEAWAAADLLRQEEQGRHEEQLLTNVLRKSGEIPLLNSSGRTSRSGSRPTSAVHSPTANGAGLPRSPVVGCGGVLLQKEVTALLARHEKSSFLDRPQQQQQGSSRAATPSDKSEDEDFTDGVCIFPAVLQS